MNISAQLPGELAVGEEKDRIHTSGPDIGTFWVSSYTYLSWEDLYKDESGVSDFTESYVKTLRDFMAAEPRVREGHAFRVGIIA